MGTRGQGPNAWRERWQKGMCPVHGRGLFDDGTPNDPDLDYVTVSCPKEECGVKAAQWQAHKEHHSTFGWLAGPDDVRAALVKAGEVMPDSPNPGAYARECRTEWPLGDTF